jgi:hypothetical protein
MRERNCVETKLPVKLSSKFKIDGLAIEDSKFQIAEMVDSGKLIVGSGENISSSLFSKLGPLTQQFFTQYPAVSTKNGACLLAISEIRFSEYAQGFISIGHSEDWDIVQLMGEDHVFIIEGSERDIEDFEVSFPSIYHFLISETKLG